MGKQEVIDYVMTTPSNPNRAVLEGMLDSIAEAGNGTLLISIADINYETKTITYDKTWQQVNDALKRGAYVTLQLIDTPEGVVDYGHIIRTQTAEASSSGEGYTAEYEIADGSVVLQSETPQDYLILSA